MPRSLPEWIGRTPDTPVPPRVRVRVFIRDDGRCQCGCRRRIAAGEAWRTDHAIAIINGGENRESNLRTLLSGHHDRKTAADVAEKAAVARLRLLHLGLRKAKRPMPGGRDSGVSKTIAGPVVPRLSQAQRHAITLAAREVR